MSTPRKTVIITGPTSGIGRAAALRIAAHAEVLLVGRDRKKLEELCAVITRKGQHASFVVCDVSDLASVRKAVAEIVSLKRTISAVLNNAGIMQQHATKSAQGWDLTFATNHLGPFALTEALLPHLPDGAQVLFVGSATEDPERKPAVMAGFRGGRFISVDACARGEWLAGGSERPGMDAYATSKQCVIAAAIGLARETPRLRINAIEPGFNPATSLGRADLGAFARIVHAVLIPILVPLLMPFVKILTTTKRAGRVLASVVLDTNAPTATYFNERGLPMRGSPKVHDPSFQARVVAETRAFLSAKAT